MVQAFLIVYIDKGDIFKDCFNKIRFAALVINSGCIVKLVLSSRLI